MSDQLSIVTIQNVTTVIRVPCKITYTCAVTPFNKNVSVKLLKHHPFMSQITLSTKTFQFQLYEMLRKNLYTTCSTSTSTIIAVFSFPNYFQSPSYARDPWRRLNGKWCRDLLIDRLHTQWSSMFGWIFTQV